MKINDFIKENHVRMEMAHWYENPNMIDSQNMDHWKCMLKCKGHQMTVYFSQGYGHNGACPNLKDVLDCLASDSVGVENAGSFEEWAREYGYDTDSRKAEAIFNTCKIQSTKLRALLGNDAYETLLWEAERE
jgi:hypothetical protein